MVSSTIPYLSSITLTLLPSLHLTSLYDYEPLNCISPFMDQLSAEVLHSLSLSPSNWWHLFPWRDDLVLVAFKQESDIWDFDRLLAEQTKSFPKKDAQRQREGTTLDKCVCCSLSCCLGDCPKVQVYKPDWKLPRSWPRQAPSTSGPR